MSVTFPITINGPISLGICRDCYEGQEFQNSVNLDNTAIWTAQDMGGGGKVSRRKATASALVQMLKPNSIPSVPAFGSDGFNADDYERARMCARAEINVGMDAGHEYYSDGGGYGGGEYSRYGGNYENRAEWFRSIGDSDLDTRDVHGVPEGRINYHRENQD